MTFQHKGKVYELVSTPDAKGRTGCCACEFDNDSAGCMAAGSDCISGPVREHLYYKEQTMTGEQLKAEGQARVMTRTGSGWLDMALAKFKDFCVRRYIGGEKAITFDQFRISRECPEPPHHNAWGALPRMACKAGYIQATAQYEKALRHEAHARRVRVWAIQPEAL